MTTAKFVTEVSITDPDSNTPVEVAIYKEEASGAMFGVDSSFITSNFDEDETIEIPSPFGNGQVELVE
ncbi:MAG: hypothetical protein CBC55_02320 [Gammaproteobacteria bacterium TMED95]|nr:MAG: hypothetical protein CBC55_02320 [Gammaproteobacteria bacterium TMED95]|tara:strand:- start:6284 stop:6487 length:204 start_codon:yes stop_codon:yes gene_type:complete